MVSVGTCLPTDLWYSLISLLRGYRDVFAWAIEEVAGIPHHLIIHKLNVHSRVRLVKQKRRHFGPEHSQTIVEEVDKLLPSQMIKKVQYST